MNSTHNCPIAANAMQFRDGIEKFCRFDFPQILFSELFCNLFHLLRNADIVFRQVGMTALCIGDTNMIPSVFKVQIVLLNFRIFHICKINIDESADRADHLIHQTAALSEIPVFCILSDFCNLNSTCFSFVVILVDNRSNQHFKCCRRRKSAAAEDAGCRVCIKARYGNAHFCKSGSNASNQCSRLSHFCQMYTQIGQVDNILRIICRLQTNYLIFMKRYNCNCIQIDCCSQHTSMLVVGVVAADFRSARCRINIQVFPFRIQFCKCLNRIYIPLPLLFQCRFCIAIQQRQLVIHFSTCKCFCPFDCFHKEPPLKCFCLTFD